MPPKRTTKVKYYTLTDSGYVEIDATPQELETYLEESQEWRRVRHGRWKGKSIAGYSTVKCSECGYVFMENSGKWNYCPNCGAKMDQEENT